MSKIFFVFIFGVVMTFDASANPTAEQVKTAIASEATYPRAAQARNKEGTVMLFISNEGFKIHKSSGHEELDDMALKAAAKAFSKGFIPAPDDPFFLPLEFRLVDAQ